MSLRKVTITGGGGRGSNDSGVSGGARLSTINTSSGSQGPRHAVFNWKQELLSESTDGATKVYELSKTPTYSLTVSIYLNGVLQRQGTDYTVDGKVITFSEIVPAEYNILAKYNAIALER